MCDYTTISISTVKGNVSLQFGTTRNNAAIYILVHVSWNNSVGYVIKSEIFWPWHNIFLVLVVNVE